MKKSKYTLWQTQDPLNRRWGVNETKPYGVYTAGPHAGYDTRKAAFAALRALRARESTDEFLRNVDRGYGSKS